MPTVGEILPRFLEEMGIDTVFGIPGVHTVELYRGLPATSIRHVTPRHEQGAGFMADGHWRASGRIAACFIISGPGMTNIATAMGQAYADSIPMLVISSVLGRDTLGRGEGRLHEMKDQSGTMAGVAAWSHTVMAPHELPQALARAHKTFHSARPRPVHIELPLDVIVADGSGLTLELPQHTPHLPDPDAVQQAADILTRAKRALVVLGGGASHSPVAQRALVERLGAPVITTINAKGILPPDHPLLLGSLLPTAPVLDELAAADAVLAIGTELGETDTYLMGKWPRVDGTLIRVDIEPEQLARNADAALGIVADAGAFSGALTAALASFEPLQGADRAQAVRGAARGGIDPAYAAHGRILTGLAKAFPGLVVVGDQTQPVYGANLSYDPAHPRSYFTSSTGFGTLGYAVPAGFGAKLSRPEAPVLSLIGDGGFQFTLPELAAGVELGLPVPILLWNNQGYGEIKQFMRDRQIPQIGVDIYTPDFQTIARGFGANAVKADSMDALLRAVGDAFGADRPTLIEVDDQIARFW